MRLRITLALWAALLAGAAHAALFDDDEARKQIFQLKNQVEARQKAIEERLSAIDARLGQLDSSGQNRVVDLAQLIESLRQDVAKLRGQIEVANPPEEKRVFEAVDANEKVQQWLAGKQIVKRIYVPGKLVNVVVK